MIIFCGNLLNPYFSVALASDLPKRNPSSICTHIRIADTGREYLVVINAVFSFLTEKLGYLPKTVFVKPQYLLYRMENHGIDVFLTHWREEPPASENNNRIHVFPKPILANLEYSLAVPYYLKQQGLSHISDLPRFANRLNSIIFSVDESKHHNEILSQLITLHPDFQPFKILTVPNKETDTFLSDMVQSLRPFVILSWQPNSQNQRFQLSFLAQDPIAFSPETTEIPFPRYHLYAIAKKEYVQACPNIARLITNLSLNTQTLEQLMAAILEGQTPVQELIIPWLKKQPRFLARVLGDVRDNRNNQAFRVVMEALNAEAASSP